MSFRQGIDTVMAYKFLRKLTTPFNKTDAFKLGLIDKNGIKVRSPETAKERDAWTYHDRIVFNLKKLLNRLGGESRIKNYASALLLLKEGEHLVFWPQYKLQQNLLQEISNMSKQDMDLFDETIANSTGVNVPGTGDDKAHWSKKRRTHPTNSRLKGHINATKYLYRKNLEAKRRIMDALNLENVK